MNSQRTHTEVAATDKQLRFLMTLANERQIDDRAKDEIIARVDRQMEMNASPLPGDEITVSKFRASEWITRLLDKPRSQGTQQKLTDTPLPLVPDGRYAVEIDGAWHLFRIWRGTRNPFVQHVYAVAGTEKGDRIYDAQERAAVLAIEKDPGQAAIDFGHRTGHCSRCGKELERNLQRWLGIGETCMKHWFADEARYEKCRIGREQLRAAGIDPTEKHDDLEPARLLAA
jgi:hypothetical protein